MQPSEKLVHQQDKMFTKKNALFPITRSLCKKYTIPSGVSSVNTPNIVNGVLPRQVVIGLLRADALNGDPKLNPFNFQHFYSSYLTLRVNGIQFQVKHISPTLKRNSFGERFVLYMTIYELIRRLMTTDAESMSTTSWEGLHCLLLI